MGANRTREGKEAPKGPQEEQGAVQRQKPRNESGRGGGDDRESPRGPRSSRHKPRPDLTVWRGRRRSSGKGGRPRGGRGGEPGEGRSPR